MHAFKPAWWLRNRHLQTLWPTLCRKSDKRFRFSRERVELPDGDFIDLDWSDTKAEGPIIIILHGLEGSLDSAYAKGLLKALHTQGYRGLCMNFRGCSGEINRLARAYHSGETEDLATIVQFLQNREPTTPMAAVGFSLGGNVLLKWLGESANRNPLKAAVAVSVPFELDKAVDHINRGFAKIYQWHLLKSLHKKMQAKFSAAASFYYPCHKSYKTLREFDDKCTAPLHGFKDAKDYYKKSSSRQFLAKIKVPTLLIQAKDDPFLPCHSLPLPMELAPCIQFELSEHGGHVGFISGNIPFHARYWLDQRIPLFLKGHI